MCMNQQFGVFVKRTKVSLTFKLVLPYSCTRGRFEKSTCYFTCKAGKLVNLASQRRRCQWDAFVYWSILFFDLAHHFIRWIKYLFAGISKFCPLPRLESHATRSKQRSITQWTNQKQGNEPYQKLRVVCNIYFKKEIYRLMKPLSVTGCTHRLQSPLSKRLKTGW